MARSQSNRRAPGRVGSNPKNDAPFGPTCRPPFDHGVPLICEHLPTALSRAAVGRRAVASQDVGHDVGAFEAFRAGDNDFRPQLSKIKTAKPDWIGIYYGATPELTKVVNQMAELGVKAEMLTGFGTFNDPVAWDPTEGKVKGGYSWSASCALEDPVRLEVGPLRQGYVQESPEGENLTAAVIVNRTTGLVRVAKRQ